MADSPLLVFRTLGTAEVSVEPSGEGLQPLGAGKPMALLLWLCSQPGTACNREQAIDLLWSDVDPDQARHALRQTIWYVRRRLGDNVLLATRDSLRIGISFRSDHTDLLRAVAGGRNEEAVSLYHGEFLPELALPGGLAFEHWADVERQQARLAFLHSARLVVRGWSGAGRHKDATALARRVRDMDGNEANCRLLLESLIAGREWVTAALEADALERSLEPDGGSLEASTRALIRAARSASTEAPERGREAGLIAELVGREVEFASLLSAWELASKGRAVAIRIVGAAGLGKTRLLNDLTARLRSKRARIVAVRARPAERLVPYSHAADIVAVLAALKGAAAVSPANAGALVALNPSLSATYPAAPAAPVGEEAFRQRVLAVHELVAAVSDEAPLAVLLDDHHWADQESRRLIASVVSRLEHAATLIVIASRPGYSELPIVDARRLDLVPLSATNTSALVNSIAELPNEPWSAGFCSLLHDVSGGTPLLILETLQSLIERGLIRVEDHRWVTPSVDELMAVRNASNAIHARVRQSSEEERLVLSVLALLGAAATDGFLADVIQRPPAEVTNILSSLESRGLVVGDQHAWWPAHDLLSESFVEQLSGEERCRLHRALGDRLLAGATDESVVVRASRHFADAGAADRLIDAFVRWVQIRRERGDNRSVSALARTFSPDVAASPGLWRRIPPGLRFPHWRGGAAIAAGLGAVLLIGSRAFSTEVPPPDAMLAIWYDSAGRSVQWDVPVRRADLVREDLLPVTKGTRRAIEAAPQRSRFLISPDGSQWIGDRTFGDSGGMDVVIADARLATVTRIGSVHDDFNAAWSPDGRKVVFATGRFHPDRWNDIAVYDVATGAVTQLTSGDGVDMTPFWSPLGTRIAFSRRPFRGGFGELCVMDADGENLECHPVDGVNELYPLGWYDDRMIVVGMMRPQSVRDAQFQLRLVELGDSLAFRTITTAPRTSVAALSPDGKWIACACELSPHDVGRWTVFPIDNPELRAEIVRDRVETLPMVVGWTQRRRTGAHLARIEIDGGNSIRPLNAPMRLGATGYRADNRLVNDLGVRWSIVRGDAARLEGDVLVPIKPGRVTVRANAGGWKSAETDFTISTPAPARIAEWSWSDSLGPDWIPFGKPSPRTGPDVQLSFALHPNGDGSFVSGVLSRRVFDGHDGLAVAMPVSIRVTRDQWQSLAVTLVEQPDSVTADPTPGDDVGIGANRRSCSFGIPGGEGPAKRLTASVASSAVVEIRPAAARLTTGAPFNLVVQLLADGSCGAAIDGKVVAFVPASGKPIRRARLAISGQAVEARVAVGHLSVYSGALPAIDWRQRPR